MASASNVRVGWQQPEASTVPEVPLAALPFPAAIADRSGVLSATNSGWLEAYPAAIPGSPPEEYLAILHATSAERRNVMAEGIQDLLDGAKEHFVQELDWQRFQVTCCGNGILIVREDLAASTPLAEFKVENAASSQKMESVGRLVGGVVHDFANLLTLISGYSEILLNRVGDGDPLRPELEEIRRAANRGARLTGQLLGFTRGQTVQPKAIDLNALITEMQRMLRPIIGEYVDLQTSLGQNLGKVVADPSQMEQVIMNLILNAHDAMPGGGRIRIETSNCLIDEASAQAHSMQQGRCVLLTVSDNGYGITADAIEHVFEPFFTTKEKGKGTGLGLSTVYRIVKESGGDVWVRSAPGEGATFSICLPCAQQTAESGDTNSGVRTAAPGSETILLVEDEDGVRRLLTHVLRRHGYQVIEACDGEQALRIFDRKGPEIHLLLTDMVMPGMSGRTLADRVREKRPETKVVFMSGYTDDVLIRTGAIGPGMTFLQKPLRPDALAAKVREALDSPARPFNPR